MTETLFFLSFSLCCASHSFLEFVPWASAARSPFPPYPPFPASTTEYVAHIFVSFSSSVFVSSLRCRCPTFCTDPTRARPCLLRVLSGGGGVALALGEKQANHGTRYLRMGASPPPQTRIGNETMASRSAVALDRMREKQGRVPRCLESDGRFVRSEGIV